MTFPNGGGGGPPPWEKFPHFPVLFLATSLKCDQILELEIQWKKELTQFDLPEKSPKLSKNTTFLEIDNGIFGWYL